MARIEERNKNLKNSTISKLMENGTSNARIEEKELKKSIIIEEPRFASLNLKSKF